MKGRIQVISFQLSSINLIQMFNFIKIAFTAAFAVLMALSACKKDDRCSVHPEAFRFSLTDSDTGSDLLASGTYQKEDIKIYYFYKGERQDLIVNEEANPDGDNIEMTSAQLPMVSLTGRSDTFYLVLSQEKTDTLYVVVEKEDRGECDYHPYTSVKHNGETLPVIEGKSFILKQ
jgi:hypothetical protein